MLICSAWRHGRGCDIANEWPYVHIEKLVLRYAEVRLLKPFRVSPSHKAEIDDAIKELEGERDKTRQQMDDYLKLTVINPNLTYVAEQLAPLQRQLVDLDRRLSQKKRQLADMERAELASNRKADKVKEAIAKLQTDDHRRLFEPRSEVHARLKSVIKQVWVGAAGSKMGDENWFKQPFRIIESKGGSELQLHANMKDPYDEAGWGLMDGDDAGDVFPDF